MFENRCYDYEVNTSGIKEYRVGFTYTSDAEFACDRAVEWMGSSRGIFDVFIGDDDIYLVCCNETLHSFLSYLEEELESLKRDINILH